MLAIGGNEGMEGALKLTTLAALRTGSGLVYAASPVQGWAPLSPEVLVVPYTLSPDFTRLDALAIGPGLAKILRGRVVGFFTAASLSSGFGCGCPEFSSQVSR
ncbi:carbohydrate kinase [Nitritalea halalkaliphila LW7]|uniref:Carbohydrate kinase n=1 Tax=Nitritalea halalkaliphila LW7 TaxID=1189621 RepID=I5BVX6_9BACT|nr:carbohydrate kinase [Nitritalea halalkaliphila LW7]